MFAHPKDEGVENVEAGVVEQAALVHTLAHVLDQQQQLREGSVERSQQTRLQLGIGEAVEQFQGEIGEEEVLLWSFGKGCEEGMCGLYFLNAVKQI